MGLTTHGCSLNPQEAIVRLHHEWADSLGEPTIASGSGWRHAQVHGGNDARTETEEKFRPPRHSRRRRHSGTHATDNAREANRPWVRADRPRRPSRTTSTADIRTLGTRIPRRNRSELAGWHMCQPAIRLSPASDRLTLRSRATTRADQAPAASAIDVASRAPASRAPQQWMIHSATPSCVPAVKPSNAFRCAAGSR